MKTHLLALIFTLGIPSLSFAQDESEEKPSIGNQIFLPSLEIGYVDNFSEVLSGGVMLKTSLEYRIRNNNDVFLRINYDTYDAKFTLSNDNGTTNIINGTVLFSDLLLGMGYRFGDKKFRYFIMAQPGLKFYDFPTATQNGNNIDIKLKGQNIFTTRFTLGFEYYLNEKSAVSIDVLHNQVWNNIQFWEDNGAALGLSVGFITALF